MIALLAASAAQAEPLTLEEAVRRATSTSDEAVLATTQVEEARAGAWSARSGLLPQVHAQAEYQRFPETVEFVFPGAPEPVVIQDRDTLTLNLVASQVLFAPSTFGRFGAADHGLDAAEAAGRGAAQDLALAAVRSWVGARAADEYLVAAEAAVADAADHLEVARNAHAAGTVTELAVDRAQLSLNRARARVIEARKSRDDLFAGLGLLVGETVDALGDAPPDLTPPPVPDALVERALGSRPEVVAADARLRAAKAGRWTVAGAWLPTVTAEAALHDTNVPLFAPNPVMYAGVSASLPVLDGGLRFAEAKRVHAEIDAATAADESARAHAEEDVRAAVREVRASIDALEVATQQVAVARRAREIIEANFQAGTLTSLDVSDAQNELLQAQVDEIRAAGELIVARWRLLRTTGDATTPESSVADRTE